jgi:hypothetical protein
VKTAVAALVVAAALAGAAGGQSAGVRFCGGSELSATFRGVPGSAGAGNIVYKLVVTNRSATTCAVTGLPVVKLYGRNGKPLPTHVRAAFPGALTAVLVRLGPGGSARASARFSPDVPGQGEPVSGSRCEPVAVSLQVTARGGGTTKAVIRPATSVCEHGSLQFTAYSPA